MAACTDADDGPSSVNPALTDIVTFTGNNDRGAVFEFNRVDDSPLITLQSAAPLDTTRTREGSRLLLRYIPASGNAATSGDVTVTGIGVVTTDTLRYGTITSTPEWDRDGLYVMSMWRTGNYVNLHCRLTYDERPRMFQLMADRRTLNDPVPQLYMVHKLQNPINSHDRAVYASFDIGSLWSKPGCRGVDIHIANTNLTDKKIFSFTKKQ